MRQHVRSFVSLAARELPLRGPVFEFGAYQVQDDGQPPSDLRGFFPGLEYVGCDMRPGPGVDRLEDLGNLALADGAAQTVLCLETLEHVFEIDRAVSEMIRVLRPGGALLVSVPFDFRIHNHPDDYWRLTPACLARLLAPLEATLVGSQGREKYPHTVLGLGFKAPAPPYFAAAANRLVGRYQRFLADTARGLSWRRRLRIWCGGLVHSRGNRRQRRDYFASRFSVCVARRSGLAGVPELSRGAPLDAGDPVTCPH